jgi:SAM-dependent methyltransferase
LFVATPLPVLVAAFEALLDHSVLATPEPITVLDAGSGDGRMLAALGLLAPAARRLRLVGIECDGDLHRDSCDRLAAVARRPSWPVGRSAALLHGDWSSSDAFDSLGLALSDFDLVLNYPDGNEARLAEQLGRLALIRPDPAPEPAGCHRVTRWPVAAGPEAVRWYVSLLAWSR